MGQTIPTHTIPVAVRAEPAADACYDYEFGPGITMKGTSAFTINQPYPAVDTQTDYWVKVTSKVAGADGIKLTSTYHYQVTIGCSPIADADLTKSVTL